MNNNRKIGLEGSSGDQLSPPPAQGRIGPSKARCRGYFVFLSSEYSLFSYEHKSSKLLENELNYLIRFVPLAFQGYFNRIKSELERCHD